MFKPNTHLLIIDPQNDFCDIPESSLPPNPLSPSVAISPALPVPGAHMDMQRLARLVYAASAQGAASGIARIHTTLDTHSPVDIAHPAWWVDTEGKPPAPYTLITKEDVSIGAWRARDPQLQARSQAYVEALERNGRFTLCVWPEHCLAGHWGNNVHASVQAALDTWSRRTLRPVNWVIKGTNPHTEHYSAIRAEVPDPDDAGTETNEALLRALAPADHILVAGEALSHCVASTVRDLARELGPKGVRRMILLEDCCSAVPGFEGEGRAFISELAAQGMRVARSADFQI